MPKFHWERTTFTGIHTEQAKTENGEAYARDMANLRIDGDGWLQNRSEITTLGLPGDNISGIATTPTHVFILREGKLFAERIDAENLTELDEVANLTGRLSVVDFTTYAVLTSEGTDRGYIIDLQEDRDTYFDIYPLGLDPPDINNAQYFTTAAANPDFAPLHSNRIYVFRLTFATIFTDRFDVLRRNERKSTPPRLIEDIESNLSNPIIYRIGRTSGVGVDFVDTDGNTYTVFEPPETHNIVNIEVTNLPHDTQANAVLLYQSGAIVANVEDTRNIDHLTYRLVDFQSFSKTDTQVTLSTPFEFSSDRDTDDENYVPGWTAQPEFRGGNDRLPAEAKQLYKYNDRIFAPVGDRLIYSDLDFGNIVPWAYPADNDIRTGERITWCAEINEVLLFGSRAGTWRLTGGTEYNFAIGQISAQGAIDAHAWGKIHTGLAFVGEAGLFVTDGSTVVELSDIMLDAFFKNKKATAGGVVFFKDNNILFSLTLKDKDDNTVDYQFKFEDGYWTRWDLAFRQAASIIEDDEATLVLIADGSRELKNLDWNSTESNDEVSEWIWESHSIDAERHGIANDLKRFSMLQFTGDTENEMMLSVYKDDETTPAKTTTFNSRASSLKPVRVPINRIARRLRFRIQGTGRCKIQGLRLDMIK